MRENVFLQTYRQCSYTLCAQVSNKQTNQIHFVLVQTCGNVHVLTWRKTGKDKFSAKVIIKIFLLVVACDSRCICAFFCFLVVS